MKNDFRSQVKESPYINVRIFEAGLQLKEEIVKCYKTIPKKYRVKKESLNY